jgi:hypothetical protein
MLWRSKDLVGIKLRGTDGTLGRVHDLLFDDRTWTVRYLVTMEISWPFPRLFLLAPLAVERLDLRARTCLVAVTRDQVRRAPQADLDGPLTPAQLGALHDHYCWPLDWAREPARQPAATAGPPLWPGYQATPGGGALLFPDAPALRSVRNLGEFAVRTKGGRPGRLADLFVRSEDWAIRGLLVDMRTLAFYRETMVAPEQIERIDWAQGLVYLESAAHPSTAN